MSIETAALEISKHFNENKKKKRLMRFAILEISINVISAKELLSAEGFFAA